MKYLIIIAALCCFAGILNLPIGYYLFLRILVSLMALIIIINEYSSRQKFWFITFFMILILFNPVVPVYFQAMLIWNIVEFAAGFLLLYYFFSLNPKKKTEKPETIDVEHKKIPRTRDRIIK